MRLIRALAIFVLTAPVLAETRAEAPAAPLGDPEAGARLYGRECSFCHEIGAGARHRTGPQLNQVFGHAVAGHEGFRYSGPLAQLGAEGRVWDAEALDAFLANPRAQVPGTRMSYRGIRDPGQRADLLAYLHAHSRPDDPPAAMPAAYAAQAPIAIPAITGDVEYGEYLAQECVTCHQRSGADQGIPAITGWPEATFVIALNGYRSGQRPHQAMRMVASRLDDEAIAALAAYFATLGD